MQTAAAQGVKPVVSCDPVETGRMFVQSASKPEYFKLKLPADLMLLPGTFVGIQAVDQDGQPAPDMAASLFARLDRVAPFYDEMTPKEHRRVFAVSLYLKSNAYDLDWREASGYRYTDKEMRRNLFCTLITPIAHPIAIR